MLWYPAGGFNDDENVEMKNISLVLGLKDLF